MTQTDTKDFGEIRSVLHSAPTQENWERLGALITQWSNTELEERILPYVLPQLHRWPDTLRVAPKSWLDDLFAQRDCPAMALVANLDVQGRRPIEDAGARVLSSSPWLTNIKRLILPRQNISAVGIRALSNSPNFSKTHTLDVSANLLHGPALRALCISSAFTSLHTLDLHHNQLDHRDIETLFHSDFVKNLSHLDLSGNEAFSPYGLEALSFVEGELSLETLVLNTCGIRWLGAKALGDAAQKLPHLQTLSLTHNALTHDTLTALFHAVPWQQLRTLILHSNWLGATGAKILAGVGSLDALEQLGLSNNSLGVAGIEHLATMRCLQSLRKLELASNTLGLEGVKALVQIESLYELEELDLGRNTIDESGTFLLSQGPWIESIQTLNLQHNRIGDEGLRRLLQRPWPSLRRLGLRLCGLSDESAEVLANSSALPNLERLDLDFNDITSEGARALVASPYLPEKIKDFWRARASSM